MRTTMITESQLTTRKIAEPHATRSHAAPGAVAPSLTEVIADGKFRNHLMALLACIGLSALVLLWKFGPEMGDSPRYLKLATNIAHGNGFSAATAPPYYPESFRAPLYPLFLSVLIRCQLGTYVMAVMGILLYTAAVAMMARLTWQLSGSKATTLVAVLFAGYPGITHHMSKVATEPLCAFFFCAGAWVFVLHLQKPAWWNTVALGLSLLGLFFTRTEYIVLIPVALIWSVFHLRRRALDRCTRTRYTTTRYTTTRYTTILACLTVFPVAAWMLRNLSVMPGSFHPLGVGAGMTLWIRSIELREPDIARRSAWLSNPDFQAIHTGSNPIVMAQSDNRLLSEAKRVIAAHPVDYLAGAATKFCVREWIERYSPEIPRSLIFVVVAASSSLLLASYFGVFLWRHNPQVVPVLSLCFAVAATHAFGGTEARYTSPVRPVLYLFAAYWIIHFSGRMLQRRADRLRHTGGLRQGKACQAFLMLHHAFRLHHNSREINML